MRSNTDETFSAFLDKNLDKIGFFTLSGIAIASTATFRPAPVFAQAAYGSYVGIGGSLGLTEGVDDLGLSEDRENGVVVAARYKLLRFPISLRAQGIFGPDGSAVVPTVSYDIPLTWQADIYVGAGGSFVTGNTPVGDRSSFAIQPGIDYSVPNSRLVVFVMQFLHLMLMRMMIKLLYLYKVDWV